jgi:hypothetical protein
MPVYVFKFEKTVKVKEKKTCDLGVEHEIMKEGQSFVYTVVEIKKRSLTGEAPAITASQVAQSRYPEFKLKEMAIVDQIFAPCISDLKEVE